MARRKNISKQTRFVLTELYNAPEKWWHGYELCKHTGLKSGTLYPILMRLSDQDYLKSEWREADKPGKPPRHVYKLTGEGRKLVLSFPMAENDASMPAAIKGATS